MDTVVPKTSNVVVDAVCTSEERFVEMVPLTEVTDYLVITVVTKRNNNPIFRFNTVYDGDMKTQITTGGKLKDNTVNHALLLLHKQFPLVEGFEDTELASLLKIKMKKTKLQILHGAGHWIAMNAKKREEIDVYDSLFSGASINDVFLKQICSIVNTSQSSISINLKSTQQQTNDCDCGVFAIAHIADLAFDKEPANKGYDVTNMRSHLEKCMAEKTFSSFPPNDPKKRIKRSKDSVARKEVYCSCRQAFYCSDIDQDKYNMVECSMCEEWFHKCCQKIPVKVFKNKNESWACSSCKNG